MAEYTFCVSRNFSAQVGKSNGMPIGQVIQIVEGDRTAEFKSKSSTQDEIFFFKVVTISPAQANTINEAIGDETKNVTLNLSPADIATLNVRGSVPSNVGGPKDFSDVIITDI